MRKDLVNKARSIERDELVPTVIIADGKVDGKKIVAVWVGESEDKYWHWYATESWGYGTYFGFVTEGDPRWQYFTEEHIRERTVRYWPLCKCEFRKFSEVVRMLR